MEINADFSKRAVVFPQDYDWVNSPVSGVERMMLDRIGGEVARATTIVRFRPGCRFEPHTHDGGEEILVLDGVFSDETGHYPAGSYLRNPVGSKHTPYSSEGCTVFVKLHQFTPDDSEQFSIDTRTARFVEGLADGLTMLPLHDTAHEKVSLIRWAPGARLVLHDAWGGEEIFVLQGSLQDEHGVYPQGSWIRNPHMWRHAPFSEDGCLIYSKTGHLGTGLIC